MRDCDQKWRSVRKVRYLDDVESSMNYALQHAGSLFSKDMFTSYIIERRQIRHNLIQKHYQRSIERTKRSLYSTKFMITLPDTLTFLKEMKIFAVKNKVVKPLELTEEAKNVQTGREKRKLILKYVLSSKYKAYTCFLDHLIRLGQFIIPKKHSRRDRQFREFMNNEGFLTDVASFYTIRDLFYELDVVNWCIDDENNLTIYPTASMGDIENVDQWDESLEVDNLRLFLRRRVNEQLALSALVELYLNLTNRRFMTNADLLQLRDTFCRRYGIGDLHFKDLLLKYYRNQNLAYKISLNYGPIKKRRRNYDLKIISLPRVSSNRLALYITIDRKVSQ